MNKMMNILIVQLLLCCLSVSLAFVALPQRNARPAITCSSSSSKSSSVPLWAKNGEFTVVEDDKSDRANDDLESSIVQDMDEHVTSSSDVATAADPLRNVHDDAIGGRWEYAALSPGTVTTLQIQVGDLGLARKAWKKRRRSGSPLLVPCSVLALEDRASMVRDNILYLLYKFGTGQKDGVVLSLGKFKSRYKSHLHGNLQKHVEDLGYESTRDMMEHLFSGKAIQDTYGVKLFIVNANDSGGTDEVYLKSRLSKYRALQKASRATLLQVTRSEECDDNDNSDHNEPPAMKHTGHIRVKAEQQPDSTDSNNTSNSSTRGSNKTLNYKYPPLSAALRVSQKDDVDSGKIEQGSIHSAVFFDFDAQGDGGSPLLTLSLNPARKPKAKSNPITGKNPSFVAPKYTPIKSPRVMLDDMKVGDGPFDAKIVRLIKDHALVDFGVGRKFTQPQSQQQQKHDLVGAPEFVKVFGMLRFKDAIDPDSSGDSPSHDDWAQNSISGSQNEQPQEGATEEDVFASMNEMLSKLEDEMGRIDNGEEFEDITHMFDLNEDGSLNYKNPETGETEVVNTDDDEDDNEEVIDDDEDEELDRPVTLSVPSSVQKAQRRLKTIRLRPGDVLPVHVLSVSKQSSQFRVTTDLSLVQGKKAKDVKKESGVSKKLEKLSTLLGGLDKAEELKGREYEGTVKATSQTGDWLYVQPTGDDGELNLPVGVATIPGNQSSEYAEGDRVRIKMDGIDESRGQLAMSVVEKLSP